MKIMMQGRNRDKFDTKIQIQHMENGPTPDTAAFIQRMEEVNKQIFMGLIFTPF